MSSDKVAQLEFLISGMELPFYRKTIRSIDGVRWLSRNMGVMNLSHKNYDKASILVKELLKRL